MNEGDLSSRPAHELLVEWDHKNLGANCAPLTRSGEPVMRQDHGQDLVELRLRVPRELKARLVYVATRDDESVSLLVVPILQERLKKVFF